MTVTAAIVTLAGLPRLGADMGNNALSEAYASDEAVRRLIGVGTYAAEGVMDAIHGFQGGSTAMYMAKALATLAKGGLDPARRVAGAIDIARGMRLCDDGDGYYRRYPARVGAVAEEAAAILRASPGGCSGACSRHLARWVREVTAR